MFAKTPKPPYYAVIFTSLRTRVGDEDYACMAARMIELAGAVDGFLGAESARNADGLGITVSYWRDEMAIGAWKQQVDHLEAQQRGREQWYLRYQVRVASVGRAYAFCPE